MSVAERLATPPRTRTTAVAWSAAAALGSLFALFGADVLTLPSDDMATRQFVSDLTGLVGAAALIPFLRSVHSAVRRTGVPSWLIVLAYALLGLRLVVLAVFVLANNDDSLGVPLGILALLLLGGAAGCAAVAWLPETAQARTPSRIAVVGIVIGVLVMGILFTGGGLLLIVVSLALALMAAFRKPADPAAA